MKHQTVLSTLPLRWVPFFSKRYKASSLYSSPKCVRCINKLNRKWTYFLFFENTNVSKNNWGFLFKKQPIKASDKYGSVLQRLQDDPELSEFTANIPSDLRSQLGSPYSKERYTVYAPTNAAWQAAKRGIRDSQVGCDRNLYLLKWVGSCTTLLIIFSGEKAIADLVKQHVQDGLTCGQSIDDQNRLLGPSKANTFIRGMQQPGGSRVLEDACGNKATFKEMDLMAGNGVVHKLNSALQSPVCKPTYRNRLLEFILCYYRQLSILFLAMDFRGAMNCLANGPDSKLSQAAREMANCGINVQSSENVVVLLPTPEALRGRLTLTTNGLNL